MADSSEPAFLFLYRKEAVAPVDYLYTFATAPFLLYTSIVLTFTPGRRIFPFSQTAGRRLPARLCTALRKS